MTNFMKDVKPHYLAQLERLPLALSNAVVEFETELGKVEGLEPRQATFIVLLTSRAAEMGVGKDDLREMSEIFLTHLVLNDAQKTAPEAFHLMIVNPPLKFSSIEITWCRMIFEILKTQGLDHEPVQQMWHDIIEALTVNIDSEAFVDYLEEISMAGPPSFVKMIAYQKDPVKDLTAKALDDIGLKYAKQGLVARKLYVRPKDFDLLRSANFEPAPQIPIHILNSILCPVAYLEFSGEDKTKDNCIIQISIDG